MLELRPMRLPGLPLWEILTEEKGNCYEKTYYCSLVPDADSPLD
jgi:hypothetical protein